MFKVIYPFRDLEDTGKSFPNGRVYAVGDEYPATKRKVSDERISELKGHNNKIGYPLIEGSAPEIVEPVGNADYPWFLGGGYYELSDGSKVRGKDAAQEAQDKLGDE